MCKNAKLDVFAKVSDMSKYLRNSSSTCLNMKGMILEMKSENLPET